MRSILVQAGRDSAMDARLQAALDLARLEDGHVTLLIDTPIDMYVSNDPFGGVQVAADALKEALADDDLLADEILVQLQRGDVPFDVIKSELSLVDALADASRLADLVIVSRQGMVAGDLAVAIRSPVLVMPGSGAFSATPAAACLAWDGGDECAAAMRHAVPLLARAGSVHVLAVGKARSAFPATGVLAYLARHGVKAELHELDKAGSTEETLLGEVRRLGAGLLVMGAFGHSRLREMLLGGVTRHLLTEPDGPALLLAH